MNNILRCICVVLAFSLTIPLIGCKEDKDPFGGKIVAYNHFVDKVDSAARTIVQNAPDAPITAKFKKSDLATKTLVAAYLADDMAIAQTFDLVTDDMLVMAGNAVKAYPHPLLLNNYAAMLTGIGSTEEALFFFLKALDQEPDNPILLTNIANMYIELNDFDSAKDFAARALQSVDDFGPAYQVLTTVHLKNKNSDLAVETMVKSAKHTFNDITIHHFESFLEAVNELNPQEDDYPMKEHVLDELYKMAKTNVDTKDINEDVDVPEAQITIKPFPKIKNPEHLMEMEQYLQDQNEKIFNKGFEADQEALTLSAGYFDHMYGESSQEGVYPVVKNVRQVYAYQILESFYEYKLNQGYIRFMEQTGNKDEILSEVDHKYSRMYDDAKRQVEEVHKEAMAIIEAGGRPDERKITAAQVHEIQVWADWEREKFNALKQFTAKFIAEAREHYNDSKQIIEEFWLKSGGLIKYMVNESVFHYMNARREAVVYRHAGSPLSELAHMAFELRIQEETTLMVESLLQSVLANISQIDTSSPTDPTESESQAEENGDMVPDIEKQAIAIYPERGDLPPIGLEAGLFGHNVSVSYDGDMFEFSYDTLIFGSGTYQGRLSDLGGESKSYTIHGVKAEANTGWFNDTKMVQHTLEGAGKTGKVVNKLGSIGFGFTNSTRTGDYTSKSGNIITDRGLVHVREKGGDISKFGKTEKVEVFKSYMTGVAIKSTSVKYKFEFLPGFSVSLSK